MKGLTIGQVASATGVGVETVRFYERQGLIEQPSRPREGFRQYPPETVAALRFRVVDAARKELKTVKEGDDDKPL